MNKEKLLSKKKIYIFKYQSKSIISNTIFICKDQTIYYTYYKTNKKNTTFLYI